MKHKRMGDADDAMIGFVIGAAMGFAFASFIGSFGPTYEDGVIDAARGEAIAVPSIDEETGEATSWRVERIESDD